MKDELQRRTDAKVVQGSRFGELTAGAGFGDFASDSDRLDGYHASTQGLPGTIPVLDELGFLPVTSIPDIASDAPVGHRGRQYIGPTASLVAPLGLTDTSVDVSNNQWTGNERIVFSHWTNANYETVILRSAAAAVGPNKWRYQIERTAAQEYPVGSTAVSLGNPDTGGYVVINSAGGPNSGRIAVYQNDSTAPGGEIFRGAFGNLSGLPVAFTDLFPGQDFANRWGTATVDGFFSGNLVAYGGTLVNLDITGTLTVQKADAPAWMEIGATSTGYGWVLRTNSGPAIMAVAPYEDDNGSIISPVAFIITHNNTRGLYYYVDQATNTGRLEISVNTLVSGRFNPGQRLLMGPGEWGVNFNGIAIDADMGLLGLLAGDTKPTDPNGTYQVWFDTATGKLKVAQGDITFDGTGHKIAIHDDDNQSRRLIRWLYVPTGGVQAASFGALGKNTSQWTTTSGDDALAATITMTPGTGTGIALVARTEGDGIAYQVSTTGAHRFLVGDREALVLGGGSGVVALSAPMQITGPVSTTWNGAGWVGIGALDAQALLHVNGISTQLRLSSNTTNYAEMLVNTDFNISTTGNVIVAPVGRSVLPAKPYDVALGSPTRKFLSIDVAEIHAETLVARETMTVFGGRALIGPSTSTLAYDVQASDVVIYVKHSGFVNGDIIYLEAYRSGTSQVEFMQITSTFTAAAGGFYRYSVTRNLDNTTANVWYAGDAVFSTGNVAGVGFLDIYALRGVKSANEAGPTIVGNVRQSTTYNDWAPRWAIGNLKGDYGYSVTTWGAAFGNYATTWVATDDTNGFRIMKGSTTVAQWDTSGAITLYANGTNAAGLRLTSTAFGYFNGTTNTTYIDNAGNFFLSQGTGASAIVMSSSSSTYRLLIGGDSLATAPFSVTPSGFVTATSGRIANWYLVGSSFMNASSGGTTGMQYGSGATIAFWAGGASGSAPFRVDHNGYLVAANAKITGDITASTGTIGNFTLDAGNFVAGNFKIKTSGTSGLIEFNSTATISLSNGVVGIGSGLSTPVITVTGPLESQFSALLNCNGGLDIEGVLTNYGDAVVSGATKKLRFFGGTATQTKVSAYTQTYSTADKTLSAYSSIQEGTYSGIDNSWGSAVYAQVGNLNSLRLAYENLRLFVEDLAKFTNSLVDDLQAYNLI